MHHRKYRRSTTPRERASNLRNSITDEKVANFPWLDASQEGWKEYTRWYLRRYEYSAGIASTSGGFSSYKSLTKRKEM
jgi:hypothetical protein